MISPLSPGHRRLLRQLAGRSQSDALSSQTDAFDPKTITAISEKVFVSHYDNNYVGAVKRLNAIGAQLAELISPKLRISSSTD